MTTRGTLNVKRPVAPGAFAASLAVSLAAFPAWATTYYVSPTGNNVNPGTTLEQPFATMARAQQAVAPGDTVYLRGGTYKFTSTTEANGIALSKSGTSGNRIKYWAYQNEIPVFDFSGMTALTRITGLRVTASWIHLKGIEVKLVPQNITTENESWGIHNVGSNNIFEMLNLHHNMGPGFFLAGGGNNLILNCDSHHNYDPKSKAGMGENADGFGCHPKAGDTGNVYRGIRAWWNTDDGFDCINALEACLVENSWAWYNGYLPDTMTEPMRHPETPPGNGNGFKLGGFGLQATLSPPVPPKHTIRGSLAFYNVYAGFFANYHTSGNYYYGNTGIGNGADFDMKGLNDVNTSVLRNNLAFGPVRTRNMLGTDDATNSWTLPVQVTEADFQSLSIQGMDGPRQADGSLPVLPFMRLVGTSDVIDKGVKLTTPYNGAAPDLGAFEYAGLVDGGAGNADGGARDGAVDSAGGSSAEAAAEAGTSSPGDGAIGSDASATGADDSAGMADGSGGSAAGAAGSSGTAGGVAGGGAGASAGAATGGGAVSGGGAGATGGSPLGPESSGCSCRVGGPRSGREGAAALVFMGLALIARRRRRR